MNHQFWKPGWGCLPDYLLDIAKTSALPGFEVAGVPAPLFFREQQTDIGPHRLGDQSA